MDYMHGEGINVLPCPACSPDLNPIEQLWDQLKIHAYCHMDDLDMLDDLWRIAIEEGQCIPNCKLVNLIHSMTTCCTECFQANGGYNHYRLTFNVTSE